MSEPAAEILTVEAAAELLQLTPATVRQMASRGLIPGRRLGRVWRFSRRQLIAFIEGGNELDDGDRYAPEKTVTTGMDVRTAIALFNALPGRRRGGRRP